MCNSHAPLSWLTHKGITRVHQVRFPTMFYLRNIQHLRSFRDITVKLIYRTIQVYGASTDISVKKPPPTWRSSSRFDETQTKFFLAVLILKRKWRTGREPPSFGFVSCRLNLPIDNRNLMVINCWNFHIQKKGLYVSLLYFLKKLGAGKPHSSIKQAKSTTQLEVVWFCSATVSIVLLL